MGMCIVYWSDWDEVVHATGPFQSDDVARAWLKACGEQWLDACEWSIMPLEEP